MELLVNTHTHTQAHEQHWDLPKLVKVFKLLQPFQILSCYNKHPCIFWDLNLIKSFLGMMCHRPT